jgi:hypothetical protein
MPREVALFIDANQYLKLYGLVAGRKLLDALEEQKEHIFISQQIVDEVMRSKLRCAQDFFLKGARAYRRFRYPTIFSE